MDTDSSVIQAWGWVEEGKAGENVILSTIKQTKQSGGGRALASPSLPTTGRTHVPLPLGHCVITSMEHNASSKREVMALNYPQALEDLESPGKLVLLDC